MKKLIMMAVASMAMLFSGCKDLPSVETVSTLSKSIGYAAAVTCNLANVPEKVKNTISEVLDVVGDVVPATNETFTAAWTPVVKKLVDEFVAKGKLDQGEGQLVILAMGVVTKGLDYMFDVRWPKARQYKDLVSAGTKGFIEGYKSVLKATTAAKGTFNYDKAEYDKAIEFLKK